MFLISVRSHVFACILVGCSEDLTMLIEDGDSCAGVLVSLPAD